MIVNVNSIAITNNVGVHIRHRLPILDRYTYPDKNTKSAAEMNFSKHFITKNGSNFSAFVQHNCSSLGMFHIVTNNGSSNLL